jgi:ribonuclease R
MSHKVGLRMNGVVSSVTEFGLFVELEEFYVDGLVHITSLGQDYYHYDAERRRLVGEHSGKEYKTGDRLEVQVARVDMEQGRIDFSLTEVKEEKFNKQKSTHNHGKFSSKSKVNYPRNSNKLTGDSKPKRRKKY